MRLATGTDTVSFIPRREQKRRPEQYRPTHPPLIRREKTAADRAAELAAAQKRWEGILPLVAAREIFAEGRFPDEYAADYLATMAEANEQTQKKMLSDLKAAIQTLQ